MTHVMKIECRSCYASRSRERCSSTTTHILYRLPDCQVHIEEIYDPTAALYFPRLTVEYEQQDPLDLLTKVDSVLIDLGLDAIKAVVAKVLSHAVEGALAGGAIGAGTGASKKKARDTVAGAAIGAIAGALVGSLVKKLIVELILMKVDGHWVPEGD